MHPYIQAALIVLALFAPASAGFTIRLEDKELQANSSDETVDIFLSTDFDAQVKSVQIGAFIGESSNATDFIGIPSQYYDPEGNFQTSAGFGGIETQGGNYFWDDRPATVFFNSSTWGNNVAELETTFTYSRSDSTLIGYRPLLVTDGEVKIGTFHLDTRGISNSLKLSLYDPNNDIVGSNGPLTLTAVTTFDTTRYEVSSADSLTIVKGSEVGTSFTYSIASTPEPTSIGLAGLGLVAGAGWLRARRRKRMAER